LVAANAIEHFHEFLFVQVSMLQEFSPKQFDRRCARPTQAAAFAACEYDKSEFGVMFQSLVSYQLSLDIL
jgi:hypothetical protein